MRTPTEFELQHMTPNYDPAKAREYYLRTRKLKGRKKGSQKVTYEDGSVGTVSEAQKKKVWTDPRTGKTAAEIKKNARTRQRKELATQIKNLEGKLKKLDELIKTKMREEASEDRKGEAKKERAAKEADKPKSAAEKAEAARENAKYRDKNQQKLKDSNKSSDEADDKSGSKKSKNGSAVSDLKVLAKKVKGQIAVAKQKLAAL